MDLAIFARCLLFVLVQDVCVGGSVHRLINKDTRGQGDDIQGEGQWVETRDTESEHGFISFVSSRDLLDLPEGKSILKARLRRATNNSTDKIWPYGPYDIPVVISSEFKGNADRLWRVMRFISNRLCVKFHNVTTTFDRKNPQWFTSNGFKSNSYVLINQKSGCSANIGAGTASGPRNVSPCNSFTLNLHEMFHVVGVIHEQKATGRDSYISVQFDNVLPNYEQTYIERTDSDLLVHHFDPKTVIIYYDSSFGSNGLETFTFVRDDSAWYDIPMSHENNLFTELNSIYKCNELYCNNNQTDCGPGYFALVYGTCRCVCPDDLDPATNCQEQINQPTKTVPWPQTPMTVLGVNGCPSGFNQTAGVLPVNGFSKPTQGVVPIPISTKTNTIELPICTKTEPKEPADIDWLSWPAGGNYCIFKPRGVTCGGAFKEGSLQLTTAGGEGPTGDVGDTVVDGNSTVIKFCCQKDDTADMPLDLPNAAPFRLIAYYNSCPTVRGMTVTKGSVKMYTKKTNASGVLPPKYSATASSITLYQCLYNPPIYGCNRVVTLDTTNSSVRITTPGFATKREPNRRCFYGFKTPKNSQLRLTFNSYDVHVNDKFLVKRYHAWPDAQRVKNDHYPHQIVSVGDYLSLEYWSSWETTTKKGLNFTVDLLLQKDFCYNLTKKGEDYKGDKSVSETYEDCIPWEKANSCRDFPFDDLSLLASGNKCRNPNGRLDQPWCYTYMSETECYKRYCDVCNIKSPVDILGNCSSLILADQSYCTGAVGRFGCFKTCGMSLQTDSGYAVKGCPEGWGLFLDRCYKLFTSQLTFQAANESCLSFRPSGGLFQIRYESDLTIAVGLADKVKPSNLQPTWISGQSNPETKKWLFSNTHLNMTYLNLSTQDLNMSALPRQCLQLNASSNYQTGFWKPQSCDSESTASYICQVDHSPAIVPSEFEVDPCYDDDWTLCQAVLAVYPTFCSDERFAVSQSRCNRSCGRCAENSNCGESLEQPYHRISADWVVDAGHVMNFSCNDGLYHVGGDLQRACSSSGDFLGHEPVCADHQQPLDLKLGTLRLRKYTITAKKAYLLDHDGYRMPFDGKITKWYYYSVKAASLVLFIYRPRGNAYDYVGSNNITTVPNWKMSYNVPAAEQISAKKGDVFGMYTLTSGTISINSCESFQDKIMLLPTMTSSTFAAISKSNQTFPTQSCTIPSLGLRLEPLGQQ